MEVITKLAMNKSAYLDGVIDNARKEVKIDQTQDIDLELESLHHSVDIKDETSSIEGKSEEDDEKQISEKFNCPICTAIFADKLLLEEHAKLHSDEKAFACKICNYKYTRIQDSTRHLRTHTGDKPFGCGICKLKYTV